MVWKPAAGIPEHKVVPLDMERLEVCAIKFSADTGAKVSKGLERMNVHH